MYPPRQLEADRSVTPAAGKEVEPTVMPSRSTDNLSEALEKEICEAVD
jgi:hypothetical protein